MLLHRVCDRASKLISDKHLYFVDARQTYISIFFGEFILNRTYLNFVSNLRFSLDGNDWAVERNRKLRVSQGAASSGGSHIWSAAKVVVDSDQPLFDNAKCEWSPVLVELYRKRALQQSDGKPARQSSLGDRSSWRVGVRRLARILSQYPGSRYSCPRRH
jgi:hypothetical protein